MSPPLRPIDGEFKSSLRARKQWCKVAGPPEAFVNLSLSEKCPKGFQAVRCLCGKVQVQEERKP